MADNCDTETRRARATGEPIAVTTFDDGNSTAYEAARAAKARIVEKLGVNLRPRWARLARPDDDTDDVPAEIHFVATEHDDVGCIREPTVDFETVVSATPSTVTVTLEGWDGDPDREVTHEVWIDQYTETID